MLCCEDTCIARGQLVPLRNVAVKPQKGVTDKKGSDQNSTKTGGLAAAFLALAQLAQVIPRIDSAGMAVIPCDIERVPAHRLHFFGLGGFLIHGQQSSSLLCGLAGVAMMIVALFRAGGARAGVAQPLKAKVRAMAVVPLNIHARTGGDVHFDRLGIHYGHIDEYIQKLQNKSALAEGRTTDKVSDWL